MRLIREICAERELPEIINIHDLLLAQAFVDRIIGLRTSEIVFDGKPTDLDHTILTRRWRRGLDGRSSGAGGR